ncbi:hypothetical protein ACEV6Q_04020 [Enterobacter ludwigii]|uniref:hypothetical protein n=1 Tax=Enterobacter ludwigii TaxID=299767 RepID=UPI003BEF1DF1
MSILCKPAGVGLYDFATRRFWEDNHNDDHVVLFLCCENPETDLWYLAVRDFSFVYIIKEYSEKPSEEQVYESYESYNWDVDKWMSGDDEVIHNIPLSTQPYHWW